MNICIDCRNSWQNDTDNSGDFLSFLLCAQTSPFPAGSWQPAPVGCDARTGNWCFFSWLRHSSSKLWVPWLLERPRSATLKLSPHVCLSCVLTKQPESCGARWQWWNLCKAVWIVSIAAAAAAFWFVIFWLLLVCCFLLNFLNQHPFIVLISRLFSAHLGFDARDWKWELILISILNCIITSIIIWLHLEHSQCFGNFEWKKTLSCIWTFDWIIDNQNLWLRLHPLCLPFHST